MISPVDISLYRQVFDSAPDTAVGRGSGANPSSGLSLPVTVLRRISRPPSAKAARVGALLLDDLDARSS